MQAVRAWRRRTRWMHSSAGGWTTPLCTSSTAHTPRFKCVQGPSVTPAAEATSVAMGLDRDETSAADDERALAHALPTNAIVGSVQRLGPARRRGLDLPSRS